MRVIPFRVAPFDNGTYILVDAHRDAIVVDPSLGEKEVLEAVRREGMRVLAILNTHGHPDHVYSNAPVKEATRARLAIHRLDAYRLEEVTRPGGVLPPAPLAVADDLLEEGRLDYLADVRLEALHTPGHTEGSTCYHLPDERILFSGDVLFAGNVGRVDLPGGDARQMEASLARIADLPPETRVYPGHGAQTTIGGETGWLKGFRFAD
ncbi:MAG: MBL fold metallo-hydrolase [Chloroflexota bacterium]|nr:MBL fold metallo-hydrolase [Chloroflexota bacterium]MDE3193727.1 MBL fold metallo-hydrolase [Chloroflexota bacterium]